MKEEVGFGAGVNSEEQASKSGREGEGKEDVWLSVDMGGGVTFIWLKEKLGELLCEMVKWFTEHG